MENVYTSNAQKQYEDCAEITRTLLF